MLFFRSAFNVKKGNYFICFNLSKIHGREDSRLL